MFTLPVSVSYRDLTSRTPLKNSSRELLLNNWLLRYSNSSYMYKPSIVQAALLPGRGVCDPYRSNEPGEACVTSLAETRRSRHIPLLLVPCDVIAACCVGTVFHYSCVTSSRLRGNLVYRLVLGNGLRNLYCVTQQWADMSLYFLCT
jgi:hypothetical protein